MTHLRAARVSHRRSLSGSSRRHRRGSWAINRDIYWAAAGGRASTRYGFWRAVTDDDKRPMRVGIERSRRRQKGAAAGGAIDQRLTRGLTRLTHDTCRPFMDSLLICRNNFTCICCQFATLRNSKVKDSNSRCIIMSSFPSPQWMF